MNVMQHIIPNVSVSRSANFNHVPEQMYSSCEQSACYFLSSFKLSAIIIIDCM
jgi:hypothetical protein